MRLRWKPVLLLALATVALVLIAARAAAFAALFSNHAGILLTQDEIAAAARTANATREQVVPRIIHQIFHNWKKPGHDDEIPTDWALRRKSCVDLHPDWDVKLWTEKASRDFIAAEYPTFLATYDGYRFPVQRTDALRYFLMLHFGGIYIDLDNGCRTNLEPLLYYPVMVADGLVGALSNNILSARPNHPFWILLTQSLQEYDWNYVLPYVVVSYASGQWLEMIMWERYHNMLPAISASNKNTNTTNNNNNINIYNINTQKEHRLYRMALDWRDADSWVFFTMGPGGSWHDWDTGFFRWIGDHLVLLAVGTGLALGVAAWTCARTVRMLQKRVYGGRGKYQPIKGGGADLGRV